ncbi:hypothetical protein SB48_HM08orf05896 [Heyndrickxia coagulans]|uniref:Uncharacterized protein n=1 Tax=Heyndrickxia coagulans TaxID=1398 RepID=A0AAN0T9M2_HEYCO|nr:hypothetical protein SB48_HM08orf05896 [Heyndrickxia coagulans]
MGIIIYKLACNFWAGITYLLQLLIDTHCCGFSARGFCATYGVPEFVPANTVNNAGFCLV